MEDVILELKQAVIEGEDDLAQEMARRALESGLQPTVVYQAVINGIQEVGELWKQGQYFHSDVIMSAEAFRASAAVVEPHLSGTETSGIGKYVIGTVAGDVHNLGKMMVVTMLRVAGFEVIDLGEDVPGITFIEKVKELKPDVLGLGCYMTTTMLEIGNIIKGLRENGLRDGVKVMIGGVPVSQQFADEVGADAWGKDAIDASEKAKGIMGVI